MTDEEWKSVDKSATESRAALFHLYEMLGGVMASLEYGDGSAFSESAQRDVDGLKQWWDCHKKSFLVGKWAP